MINCFIPSFFISSLLIFILRSGRAGLVTASRLPLALEPPALLGRVYFGFLKRPYGAREVYLCFSLPYERPDGAMVRCRRIIPSQQSTSNEIIHNFVHI
jgi:hypothetical protein